MQLLLARHGNTFSPQDKVVWVGARSDLPLVEEGRKQAAAIGTALLKAKAVPQHIIAGPLLRTRETAQIVAATIDADPASIMIADSLCEIDYGEWEGRSNDEIRAEYGDTVIDGWQQRSIYPEGFGWSPGPQAINVGWSALLDWITRNCAAEDRVLIVSSNGIYRIIAEQLGLAPSAAKMNTGAVALLDVTTRGARVERWNIAPHELS